MSFHTKAPIGFDVTATHTIGIYASRVLTVFNLGTNYASAEFNFVPNGAKVVKIHDIIKTASCDSVTTSCRGMEEGGAASRCACCAIPNKTLTQRPAARWI